MKKRDYSTSYCADGAVYYETFVLALQHHPEYNYSLVIWKSTDGTFDYRVLEDMVQTINENEVAPEERLSDHVYHYDVKDRVFERADKFEERQKEKTAQLGKNEHTGKEQSMKQPKAKKHEMEL